MKLCRELGTLVKSELLELATEIRISTSNKTKNQICAELAQRYTYYLQDIKSSDHPNCINNSIAGDDYNKLKVNQVVYDSKNDCYSLDDLKSILEFGMNPFTRAPLDTMKFKYTLDSNTVNKTLQQSISHLTEVEQSINISSKLYQKQPAKMVNIDKNLITLVAMINSPTNKYFNEGQLKNASKTKITELLQVLNNWFYDNGLNLSIQQNLKQIELYKKIIETIQYIEENHTNLSETFKYIIVTSLE